MPPKRPIRNVFGDADDGDDDPSLASSAASAVPPKRTRTGTQPSSIVQSIASGSAGNASATAPRPAAQVPGSVQAQIEAARARIQAQMSNLGSRTAAAAPAAGATAAAAAPSTTSGAGAGAAATSQRPAASGNPSSFDEIQRKVAEAKARLQAMQKSSGIQQSLHQAQKPAAASQPAAAAAPARNESAKPPSGIHPLLLGGDAAANTSKAPKFASLQANMRGSPSARNGQSSSAAIPKVNPYLADSQADDAAAAAAGPDAFGARPKSRSMHKGFTFHRPGRHIEEAEEARREAQLEALKKRIQESARKAGLQDELSGNDRVLQRQPPPDVEWWDVGLLPSKSYDDVPDDLGVDSLLRKGKERETDPAAAEGDARPLPLLYGKSSPIDRYIQHPIPIAAPSDSVMVKPLGVMLTKKEQKKMRRQRRAAEQQDKRDRIKMGLLPPDPPKVKLSNLMRVLTSEAVADPTKVEARVRREIAARREAHERANAERKLTPEQRKEKAQRKVEAEEAKGIGCQVYRIRHLVAPWHKKKVRLNAQDYHLTGLTIFNPAFALVVVEGSAKMLKGFKRLMTVRMDWTDPGRAPADAAGEGAEEGDGTASVMAASEVGDSARRARFDQLATADAADVDLTENRCDLIFEGPLRERNFPHGFRAVACPNDHAARETLGPNLQGYWDLARRWTPPEDEAV